jgi:hypothetical protein
MSKSPWLENLTGEKSEALERAALLVINARNEAATMLDRAGVERPPEGGWFGSPCGVSDCPCRTYTVDGSPCLTRVTHDIASPPTRVCGHRPSQHLET